MQEVYNELKKLGYEPGRKVQKICMAWIEREKCSRKLRAFIDANDHQVDIR